MQLNYYPDGAYENTNCLMKAKENPFTNGTFAYRLFKNNTYIVDDNYVPTLGYHKKWSVVTLFNVTSPYINYEIINNNINVPVLNLQKPSQAFYKFVFNDNTIKTKAITGWLINSNFDKSHLEIQNNTITCSNLSSELVPYTNSDQESFQQFKLIHPCVAKISAILEVPRYAGFFNFLTEEHAKNSAEDEYVVDLTINVTNAQKYSGSYQFELLNGKIQYLVSDGLVKELMINGENVSRYISPYTGNLPSRLKVYDSSTYHAITVSTDKPLQKVKMELNFVSNIRDK